MHKSICEKTDKELDTYICEMLEWLRILIGQEHFDHGGLEKMDSQLLVYAVGYQVKQAILLKDNEWLTYMSYLLKNKKLYDAFSENKKCQKILKRYYESYWGKLDY